MLHLSGVLYSAPLGQAQPGYSAGKTSCCFFLEYPVLIEEKFDSEEMVCCLTLSQDNIL